MTAWQTNICSEAKIENQEKGKRHFKVNNKDTTSISIVGLNRYLLVGYAVSAKISQPAIVYSKSITVEQSVHWCCPWFLDC